MLPFFILKPRSSAKFLTAGLALACLAGCQGDTAGSAGRAAAPAISAAVSKALPADGGIAAYYRSHDLLWVKGGALRPEAAALVGMLEAAAEDGLNPESYHVSALRSAVAQARSGAPADLARAELLLSVGWADYVADLRHGPADVYFVDRELAPPRPDPERLLAAVAAAPSLESFLIESRRMNPVYEALRQALARELRGNGPGPRARTLAINLERARAITANLPRFVLVDTAGARLWMFERGKAVGTMKVVVGKSDMATPNLAGLIRFAVRNPYWNIPPDLVRDRIAPRLLAGDLDYLSRERLEILSDFSDSAVPLDPMEMDWTAVARGEAKPHLRQLPGGDNMMGRVKFMLPNRLGIYLHDTPSRNLFALADRRRSSGCVRVEDAGRLERWLFGGTAPAGGAAAEHRIDLPAPVPVFITYLTAIPRGDGIAFQPDVYGRDRVALARLAGGSGKVI